MHASAEQEFNNFVKARLPALSRTAYLLTSDAHLAEDLVQTALLATARHWRRIQNNPEAYARKVLYNENISWWRRRQLQEVPLEDRTTWCDPHVELRLTLESALKQLTHKQRTIVVLRYFEDLTEAQTAHVLGISVGTVKSVTRQAFAKLRHCAPELKELLQVGDIL
jgi:RNA polymerase sigma-70 factor (sigma-E family)